MFIDRVRIHAKAGNGGDGCASFRREKFIPKGGPDGGDGGEGGDVILRADVHVDQLASLFFKPLLRAKNGGNGSSRQKHGKSAPDVIIPVPVGTLVYRIPAPGIPLAAGDQLDEAVPSLGEEKNIIVLEEKAPVARKKLAPPDPDDLVADLAEEGQEVIVSAGGRGGRGNIHFKSSRNRAPRRFTEGTQGEESWFLLELRTIALAGLVGYPNAGKSTLLRAISAAHPKVAPYPFTTRHPKIGVVELDDYERTTVADIPGLIEGASENRGLGHEFLRHIMRCRCLFFVLDMAGSEGRNPHDDFKALRKELEFYDPSLLEVPWIVIANKMDLPTAAAYLAKFKKKEPRAKIIPICAELAEGIPEVKKYLKQLAAKIKSA
ncbi:MAG: GTPase ObgE [Verrucomicrobiae bacterium]|nr:GTPase ObgE [Verrucomicrobiae bacterium]